MAHESIAFAKQELRRLIRGRRNQDAAEIERGEQNAAICARLIALTEALGAKTILGYLSMPTEPNIRDYLNWADRSGLTVYLPIARQDSTLDWVKWHQETELIKGRFGIPEPTGKIEIPKNVDLAVLPALAVDFLGGRLGQGGGYYDRTMTNSFDSDSPTTAAVVFDDEVFAELPIEAHDFRVNFAVTPERTLKLPAADEARL